MRSKVILALGSNIGEREYHLKRAIQALSNHPDIRICETTRVLPTKPLLYEEQPFFLNQLVVIETTLTAYKLLDYCQQIEKKMGRRKTFRYGPRIIDIDLLVYEGVWIHNSRLDLPHRQIIERPYIAQLARDLDRDTQAFLHFYQRELRRR